MSEIRPLQRNELPEIVAFHERIARTQSQSVPQGLEQHFEVLFFGHPSATPDLPPLVYVADDGAIAGSLGSSVRRFLRGGRPVRIGSHLLTEPHVRERAAGTRRLLGRYVYVLKPRPGAETLRVVGSGRELDAVLDDLLYDALTRGAAAVLGWIYGAWWDETVGATTGAPQ